MNSDASHVNQRSKIWLTRNGLLGQVVKGDSPRWRRGDADKYFRHDWGSTAR